MRSSIGDETTATATTSTETSVSVSFLSSGIQHSGGVKGQGPYASRKKTKMAVPTITPKATQRPQ